MAWKLLQLTPLKPFFFGKESVFTNTNYAKSEYFPQQTQIAGALRLYWMEQNNLMRVQKDGKYVPYEKKYKATKLVGNAGSLDFNQNSDLGAIKKISPMFIIQSQNGYIKDALFQIPSDVVQKECQNIIAKPNSTTIASSKPVVILEDYNVKEGFLDGLGGNDFWENYINFNTLPTIHAHNTIYKPYNQAGIALDNNRQTKEGMFYTKKSYLLHKNYTFGILVHIDDNILKKEDLETLEDGIISMGADSSMFSLKVLEIPKIIEKHPILLTIQNSSLEKGTKIVLLSDSILTQSIHKESYFQIVPNKVPFKMMQSKEVNKNSLNSISIEPKEHKSSYSKTKEKLLIPKGSIYYFKTSNQLEEAKCAYRKMGFNQFLVIN